MALVDLRREAREAMPALPPVPHLYRSAISTWQGRMKNEHGSARVFRGLASQLARAGFSPSQVDEARSFSEEERSHGVLCGAVVEALGGEALFDEPAAPPFPMHESVPALEGVVRNLLSISCMSETVAVSLLSAERLEMPEGELRALLERILADEIGHARFGWKLVNELVPTFDRPARDRLSAYLAVAFAHLERHELAHLNERARPSAEAAALGLCQGSFGRELFYDTVSDVIVPRLEAAGLSAERAWGQRGRVRH